MTGKHPGCRRTRPTHSLKTTNLRMTSQKPRATKRLPNRDRPRLWLTGISLEPTEPTQFHPQLTKPTKPAWPEQSICNQHPESSSCNSIPGRSSALARTQGSSDGTLHAMMKNLMRPVSFSLVYDRVYSFLFNSWGWHFGVGVGVGFRFFLLFLLLFLVCHLLAQSPALELAT